MTIRIIPSKPEGIPEDPDEVDWKTETEFRGGPCEGTLVEKVAYERRVQMISLYISLLSKLPAEYEITVDCAKGKVQMEGRMWVWDEDARMLAEDLIGDLEAALTLYVQEYPDTSYFSTSNKHPQI